MKKTVYDFSKAVEYANNWYKPSEMSNRLKTEAIALAFMIDDSPNEVSNMQQAVWAVTEFLDRIEEKEVAQ